VTPEEAARGRSAEETAVLRPVRGDAAEGGTGKAGSSEAGSSGEAAAGSSGAGESEVTAELPKPEVAPGAADETAVLPPVVPGAADETAVLPQVPPGAADETAVLPPVPGEDPADRVPPGFFRDESAGPRPDGTEDRTREMPQVDEEGAPRRRARSDWAEETPLDDLPTLADELLGPREDDEFDDERGGGRGRRR
jgi:dTMP kinase